MCTKLIGRQSADGFLDVYHNGVVNKAAHSNRLVIRVASRNYGTFDKKSILFKIIKLSSNLNMNLVILLADVLAIKTFPNEFTRFS